MPERKAFVLRINKELWDHLQQMASQELRSVNAQIEYLMREAVRKRVRRLPNSARRARPAEED